jgi:molybdenum cofactor biosynthesis enzyme
VSAFLLVASLVNASTATAQIQQAPISSTARNAFAAITVHPLVKKGLAFLEADDANTLNDQKTMTVIPAPPLLGLQEVRIDSEGNAIGVRRGTGNGPRLIVSAHLDTNKHRS